MSAKIKQAGLRVIENFGGIFGQQSIIKKRPIRQRLRKLEGLHSSEGPGIEHLNVGAGLSCCKQSSVRKPLGMQKYLLMHQDHTLARRRDFNLPGLSARRSLQFKFSGCNLFECSGIKIKKLSSADEEAAVARGKHPGIAGIGRKLRRGYLMTISHVEHFKVQQKVAAATARIASFEPTLLRRAIDLINSHTVRAQKHYTLL